MTKKNNSELYRITWKTGHTQMIIAHSVRDAHDKAMRDFTGSDRILYVEVLK